MRNKYVVTGNYTPSEAKRAKQVFKDKYGYVGTVNIHVTDVNCVVKAHYSSDDSTAVYFEKEIIRDYNK